MSDSKPLPLPFECPPNYIRTADGCIPNPTVPPIYYPPNKYYGTDPYGNSIPTTSGHNYYNYPAPNGYQWIWQNNQWELTPLYGEGVSYSGGSGDTPVLPPQFANSINADSFSAQGIGNLLSQHKGLILAAVVGYFLLKD